MKPVNEFPEGWDDERVHRVLHHYESQTEDEALRKMRPLWRTLDRL